MNKDKTSLESVSTKEKNKIADPTKKTYTELKHRDKAQYSFSGKVYLWENSQNGQ